MKIDEQALDELEKQLTNFDTLIVREGRHELILLARLGLWAEKSGVPASRKVADMCPEKHTEAWDVQEAAATALAALPKGEGSQAMTDQPSREEKQNKAAELIDGWLKQPDDYDEKVGAVLDQPSREELAQQPYRDPIYDLKPEHVWLVMTNICKPGMFKVALEVNGVEKELLHTYVRQNEGVVSNHHNLTWLLNSRDAELAAKDAQLAIAAEALERLRIDKRLMVLGTYWSERHMRDANIIDGDQTISAFAEVALAKIRGEKPLTLNGIPVHECKQLSGSNRWGLNGTDRCPFCGEKLR